MSWLDQVIQVWGTHVIYHWLLGFSVALLLYWLTSTILYAQYSFLLQLTRSKTSSGVVYGILIISILVGLACALASHSALDYFVTWYQKPLGPPLELKGFNQ